MNYREMNQRLAAIAMPVAASVLQEWNMIFQIASITKRQPFQIFNDIKQQETILKKSRMELLKDYLALARKKRK